MIIDDLLNEFARTIGLDTIEPDDEPCILEFDGNPVSLSYRNNRERLLLYSDAGFLVRPAPELLLGLLEANALHQAVGDGAIGLIIDEHRGGFVVVYSQLLVTATLDLATLTDAMRNFVELLEAWQQNLAELENSASDGEDNSPGRGDDLIPV